MRKTILNLSLLTSSPAFAHSGHPGAASHGDPTHLMLGFLAVVPFVLGGLWLFLKSRKTSEVKTRNVSKETPNG